MSTISMKNDIETSVTVEDNTVPKTTLNNKKKMIIAAATVLTFCLLIFGYFGYIIYQNAIENKKIITFIENYKSKSVDDIELLEFYAIRIRLLETKISMMFSNRLALFVRRWNVRSGATY